MDLTAHQSFIQSYFKQIIIIDLIYIARSFTYSTIPVWNARNEFNLILICIDNMKGMTRRQSIAQHNMKQYEHSGKHMVHVYLYDKVVQLNLSKKAL